MVFGIDNRIMDSGDGIQTRNQILISNMKEVLILLSMNVLGFIFGWFFAEKATKWINSRLYSQGFKAILHTLMWGMIIVGGVVGGVPTWILILAGVAYLSSLYGIFVN